MTPSTLGMLTFFLLWMANLLGLSYSEVYTATVKVIDMVEQEEKTLNNLHAAISKLGNETALSCFSRFYRSRIPYVKQRQNNPYIEEQLKHPNSIYLTVKQFATDYQSLRIALGSTPPDIQEYLSLVADMNDVRGTRFSFLRLQTVYSLNAADMCRGDYLGFIGPELKDVDALEIGEVAFTEGKLDYAIQWLNEALLRTGIRKPSVGFDFNSDTVDLSGRIYALLGRCYVRKDDQNKAQEMYSIARTSDPNDKHVEELKKELGTLPAFQQPENENNNFTRLCTLQNKITQDHFDARLVCKYKTVILPYYRFKMELVSISPYVALFYNVISDTESNNIINIVRGNLKRGRVESATGVSIVKESRTSDLFFLEDYMSPAVASISKRVGAVTNLVTKPYVEGSDYFCEPFQVVNYGMGGHYAMHLDAFEKESLTQTNMKLFSTYGGNRLATFLIYLSDVERGGSTVFPRANLAVTPIKGMALLWYTFKPSGERDDLTIHAGCPVVYGHKWITNKWIWMHGNTFTRRCGLKQQATHLAVEKHMRKGWA